MLVLTSVPEMLCSTARTCPGEGEVGIVVVEDDTGEPWCDVRSELAGRRELSRGVLEVEQLPPAEALLEDLLRRQCRTGVVLYPAVHEGDVVEPARGTDLSYPRPREFLDLQELVAQGPDAVFQQSVRNLEVLVCLGRVEIQQAGLGELAAGIPADQLGEGAEQVADLDAGRGAFVLLAGLDARHQGTVQDVALWRKRIRQQRFHAGRHQPGRDVLFLRAGVFLHTGLGLLRTVFLPRAGARVGGNGRVVGRIGDVEVFIFHLVHKEGQQLAQRLLLGSIHGATHQQFHGMERLHAIDHRESCSHIVRFRQPGDLPGGPVIPRFVEVGEVFETVEQLERFRLVAEILRQLRTRGAVRAGGGAPRPFSGPSARPSA